MTSADQSRWDDRYTERDPVDLDAPIGPPAAFAKFEHHFPTGGVALDVACGRGAGAVWLAQRGLDVIGVDISPVAIESAKGLAEFKGVADRCVFEVVDLDKSLPRGSQFDVITCHMFRGRGLDSAIVERLKPGGLLAIAVLSEVGGTVGRFREPAGALKRDFEMLDIEVHAEGDGRAVLLAIKP